jgi:hypothetical protein
MLAEIPSVIVWAIPLSGTDAVSAELAILEDHAQLCVPLPEIAEQDIQECVYLLGRVSHCHLKSRPGH